MNTDGAFSLLNEESGRGVVFRGCSAHVLKALSVRFGRLCSPWSAEFEVLRVGLTEAIKLGYLTPILAMDYLSIVLAIQGKRPLLDEERKAVSSMPFHCLKDCSIVMTPREANTLVGVLERTGLSGSTKMEQDKALYSAQLVEQEDALRETRFKLRWHEMVANERDVQQPHVARTLVLTGEAQKEEIRDGANSMNNVLGAEIDLSSLSIVEGKVCGDLYIDGLVVSSDGNLLDALGAAIKAALSNTGIPKVHVGASASSDGQPEVNVCDEEFLQFDTFGVPVVVTLTKVGRHYIVDATSEEESQLSSAISVSINRQGRICGLTKRGGAGLDPSIILDMISVAKHVSEQLMNKLDSEISAAEACEEES